MSSSVIQKIATLKSRYEPEGLHIIGIFGSAARGEETADSDVDILYRSSPVSFAKYPGWEFYSLFERVKRELEAELDRKVDLVDEDALGEVGRKYILPEVRHV